MRLKDKVVLITGGSKGLGRETALVFAQEGAEVVITGRGQEALNEAVDEARGRGLALTPLVGDVSKEDDARANVAEVLDRFGRIDVLLNNAGVLLPATTWETRSTTGT